MPCKDCEKRTLGCHSTCEDYIRFSKERREMLDKIREENRILRDNEVARFRSKMWARRIMKRRKR